MKAISSSVTYGLRTKSLIKCVDNSGVKVLEVIGVRGYKGRRRMKPKAGVGSMVFCKVYSGTEKVRHQIFRAVVVRQKKEFRRPDGMRVHFEDNAAVVIDEKGDPKGSQIKGPVAKEAVERFPTIGKIATIVV
ncbi:MAG: 50S ribosomal protein L14 [Candidatus Aenigmatarchaeota archaeon]|nr:MAG: 50S ribosomal protein L14 [Candidatus Aenigmarchaeota archaeon]